MGFARAGILAVSLALAGAACNEGRFPVCKTNADCADPDAGHAGSVCYNLKCVECRYDTDCPAGKTCSALSNACEGLGTGAADDPDGGTGWDHGNWDQCAADCKDRDCIKACDQKFNK